MSTLGWLLVAAVTAMVAMLWFLRKPPVARGRVERFARRHDLTVTTANGERIIAYLAITRRWRSAGLVAGLGVSIGLSVPDHRLQVSFLALFAGWFTGALVAEGRVTHIRFRSRRTASLVSRDASRYLPRRHRLLLPAVTIACLVAGVAALGTDPTSRAALLLCTGLAIAAAVQVVQRQAVRRPQPLAEPDVLAADNAIRSRSLHVLAAAGMVLVGFCVLAQVEPLLPDALVLPGYFLLPLLGLSVATRPWPVPTLTAAAES